MKSVMNNLRRFSAPSRSFFGIFKSAPDLGVSNLVRIGNVSPELPVPDRIPKPRYYFEPQAPSSTVGDAETKTAEQILRMADSCKLAANVLKACGDIVKEGISTDEIDVFVHNKIIEAGAYPSPLRYAGFPKSVCTSVNNVACHGIPDDRRLMDGDVINIDITVFLNGFHGDCSKTYLVGNVDERGRYLVESTQECLNQAIELCAPGRPFKVIGHFIDRFARERRLTVIPAFIGHGIGSYFHGPPEIYHFRNRAPGVMRPNITFTIEPVLSLGGPEIEIQEDGWTAMSVDKARSAQFEHTVLITDLGVRVLTLPD